MDQKKKKKAMRMKKNYKKIKLRKSFVLQQKTFPVPVFLFLDPAPAALYCAGVI